MKHEPGSDKKLALSWVEKIGRLYERKKGVSYSALKRNLRKIAKSFDALSLDLSHALPKVGVVGEIYVKYAALGNNHLEEFLVSERAEVYGAWVI